MLVVLQSGRRPASRQGWCAPADTSACLHLQALPWSWIKIGQPLLSRTAQSYPNSAPQAVLPQHVCPGRCMLAVARQQPSSALWPPGFTPASRRAEVLQQNVRQARGKTFKLPLTPYGPLTCSCARLLFSACSCMILIEIALLLLLISLRLKHDAAQCLITQTSKPNLLATCQQSAAKRLVQAQQKLVRDSVK